MRQIPEFHRDFCSVGRDYFLAKDIYTRYNEADKIKTLIKENICEYIVINSAVRITLDSDEIESDRVITAVPFVANVDSILNNIVELIYANIKSYYITADNKINHYGIANTIMEGFNSSGLRRELELVCHSISNRRDIGGRVISKVNFENINFIKPKDFLFSTTIQEKLDIQLGYRFTLYGERINSQNFFIPILMDNGVLQQIYTNLEIMLHQQFVTYDETTDQGYLKITDNLILKEILNLLRRAKNKENTRKKLIQGIKFATTLTNDPVKRYGELAGDIIYDTINQVDNVELMNASDRSRAMYDTYAFRSAWETEQFSNSQFLEEFDDIILTRGNQSIPSTGVKTAETKSIDKTTEKVSSTTESLDSDATTDILSEEIDDSFELDDNSFDEL